LGPSDYIIDVDSTIKQNGQYSLSISSKSGSNNKSFTICVFNIPARYKGKEIELRGYIKTENISNGYSGFYMRLDKGSEVKYYEDMSRSGITSTNDWDLYAKTLPLTDEISNMSLGVIFTGSRDEVLEKAVEIIEKSK
jgi:hypothetical protein